jgi:dTDP-glucose 4,6-dehydratase
VVTNCSNNYGPYQFPEKLIPHVMLRALHGLPLPVYGDGRNVRDWLHVDDHARGLVPPPMRGEPGATYLFGGGAERTNLEVVERGVPRARRAAAARRTARAPDPFVRDRPGHDFRYAVDAVKRPRGPRLGTEHAASTTACAARWRGTSTTSTGASARLGAGYGLERSAPRARPREAGA